MLSKSKSIFQKILENCRAGRDLQIISQKGKLKAHTGERVPCPISWPEVIADQGLGPGALASCPQMAFYWQ